MSTLHFADLSPCTANCHIARSFFPPGHHVPMHDHDFAEVAWVERGRIRHDDRHGQLTLMVGDVMLIRPAHRHGVHGMLGAGTKVNLAFPANVLRDLERRYGAVWGSDHSPPVVRHVSAEVIADLSRRADKVRHGPDDRLAQDVFLLNLLQHLRPAGDSLWRNAPSWLADALAACAEPPALADGINALVRMTGRTREHISRTLRSTCGTTPIKIIDDLRMRWSERQLVMSDVSIQELAELCGLGRVHLHRRFTARYGCSPRTWRNKSRATT